MQNVSKDIGRQKQSNKNRNTCVIMVITKANDICCKIFFVMSTTSTDKLSLSQTFSKSVQILFNICNNSEHPDNTRTLILFG